MDQFKDKVAIVTGGASGIGRALCEELSRRGAVLVVADVNVGGARQVASVISEAGGRSRAIQVDVSCGVDVQKLVDETVAENGRLDYMFNNAGIVVAGEVRDLPVEHWRRIIDVNLWGVIHGTTSAYLVMLKQGFGHIVNTASLAGLIAFPINAPYAATKHAVVGFSTSLRAEAADLGVKVSVVCPGFVRTGIFRAATVVGLRAGGTKPGIPTTLMDATKAARLILRGVARNQAIITFPFRARFLWWLSRLHCALGAHLDRKSVRNSRRIRLES